MNDINSMYTICKIVRKKVYSFNFTNTPFLQKSLLCTICLLQKIFSLQFLVTHYKDSLDLTDHQISSHLKQYYSDETNFMISLSFVVTERPTVELPLFILENAENSVVLAISIGQTYISYDNNKYSEQVPLQYNESVPINLRFQQENGQISITSNCKSNYKQDRKKKSNSVLRSKVFPKQNMEFFLSHVSSIKC